MAQNEIPLPKGFSAAGLHCGVKKDASLFDLALFVSDRPAAAAGMFTTNLVNGAPVKVSKERVPRGTARAVVINSGNSNACTGDQGLADARWMTDLVAQQLGCSDEDVLVCSTGVIGRFLPKEKLAAGIPSVAKQLAEGPVALENAARGIMTTDTFPKISTRTAEIGGRAIRVTGVAKGAAMIAPHMATMLSTILTDAPLSPGDADGLLKHAVCRSFNCISVDGHMSTSDTVLLLANGAAGGAPLGEADRQQFQKLLDEVAMELAQMIIRDAEGATHFITIDVRGLRTKQEAFKIAKMVAESALVKTAIHGADPNWGRIVSAAGYAGIKLQESDISLKVNGIPLYKAGAPLPFDPAAASQSIRTNRDVTIELDLTLGNESVRFWTSDLTAEYVRLNADYTT
jgi:glutamate N-acetyltransferase/amino-acid N-acetyltransferase